MSTRTVSTVVPAAGSASGEARSAVAILERIDRRLERVESIVGRLESLERMLPGAIGGAVDTFDSIVERLRDRGIDVDDRIHMLVEVTERLTSPEMLRALGALLEKLALVERVLDSGILAEPSVDVVDKASRAIAAARTAPIPEVGLWRAARATSDEDVRRALGFLVRVAQLFGRSLSDADGEARQGGGVGEKEEHA